MKTMKNKEKSSPTVSAIATTSSVNGSIEKNVSDNNLESIADSETVKITNVTNFETTSLGRKNPLPVLEKKKQKKKKKSKLDLAKEKYRKHQPKSPGGPTHTVKLVKLYPNENDDGTLGDPDVWDEDGSFVVIKEGDVNTPRTRQRGSRAFPDSCFTCGDVDEIDGTTIGQTTIGQTTIDDFYDDDDTFVDKMVGGNTNKRSASSSVFASGMINPAELRKDIATEVKDAIRDIKGGIRLSIRNLFRVCDITQDGGVDILKANMTNTNDQLFGRKPVPKSAAAKSASRGAKDNRMTPRKTTTTLPNNEKQKKEPSPTEDQKKKFYLEKLKKVSLKHL